MSIFGHQLIKTLAVLTCVYLFLLDYDWSIAWWGYLCIFYNLVPKNVHFQTWSLKWHNPLLESAMKLEELSRWTRRSSASTVHKRAKVCSNYRFAIWVQVYSRCWRCINRLTMEHYGVSKWRLTSGQVVSWCIYEMPKL